jgi:hypothetical protein
MEQNKVNIEVVSIDDLIQDDHNFNKGNEQGAQLLERSFRECGAGRSVLIDKDNRLVGGNKAQKGFKAAGKKKVIIVDSDADTLVAVRRKDVSLDSAEGRKMAYLDNLTTQVNLTWDQTELEAVQADVEGFDVADFGVSAEDVPMIEPKESVSDHTQNEDNEGESPNIDEMDEETKEFYLKMIGDYIYPSNNEFDIPTLLDTNQPVHLEMPFAPWGAESRYKKGISTYHFYVDDYRFEQLYKNPILLLQSGCKAVVEPNNSIHDQTPMAYAIYQTFRKRYLTRYLQECGIQVWVDLNVSPHFEEINALGVPEGYNAFCTRGVTGWIPTTERHWAMAKRISGLEKPNMFVYGGGKDVEEWCRERDIVYIKEYMNKARKTEE